MFDENSPGFKPRKIDPNEKISTPDLDKLEKDPRMLALYKLHKDLGDVLAKAREAKNDAMLDFLETKLQTELAIEISDYLHPEDERKIPGKEDEEEKFEEKIPQFVNHSDEEAYNGEWESLKNNYIQGLITNEDLESLISNLYNMFWKDKIKFYESPATVPLEKQLGINVPVKDNVPVESE